MRNLEPLRLVSTVVTTVESEQQGTVGLRPARWIAPLFGLAALVLVPWIVVLAERLPSTHAAPHWDVTWVGFDVALSGLLIAVAVAAWRRSPWLEGTATAAAALLLIDAWFDVTTSASGGELLTSLVEALLVEVPLAVFCLLLARDAERVISSALRVAGRRGAASEPAPARKPRRRGSLLTSREGE
jgi:hypothetical protein